MIELSDKQAEGVTWLKGRRGGYLADPPGYGKTRQLLAAAADAPKVTVIAPAAIRDAEVWQAEAERIGFDVPLEVRSYHEMLGGFAPDPGALIFDEAHWLKNRKVKWGENSLLTAQRADRVYAASGTPIPNDNATELWGQLRMFRNLPAYWAWVRKWFVVVPTEYTAYSVDGTLLGCAQAGCELGPDGKKRRATRDCAHWQEFYEAEYGPEVMLRRPEEDIDLPGMTGVGTPMPTPMKPMQAKVYRELKKEFLSELPDGMTFESLSASQQFVQLWQCSTGLSSIDPTADDKHSGKLALLEELLVSRTNPSVVGCYFGNTAAAVSRKLDQLGLRWALFGAKTSRTARRDAIRALQAGDIHVLLGSITVMSEGLTLTAADQTVLVERSWRPDTNTQFVKRVHRRGQTKETVARQLVTRKTIDDGQWATLGDKTRYIDRALTRAEVRSLV